jgi:hypothetical protein
LVRSVTPKSTAASVVVSLKITLKGTKPPIWRRVLVPGAFSLGELHNVIQAAMGWYNSHLHVFEVGDRHYGDRRMVDHVADENRITLNGVMKAGVTRFSYTYDFGDNWEHGIVIEKTQPVVPGVSYPRCAAGKLPCPPEDCGGVRGYRELLEILADPEHPEHQERMEWVDDDALGPAEFDLDLVNVMLARGRRE